MMIPGLDRVSRKCAKYPGMVFLFSIVRNENPTRIRSDGDYVGVRKTDNAAIACGKEIDGWLPAAKAYDNLVVEVRVGQELRPHAEGA